jgi:hypothetical protein
VHQYHTSKWHPTLGKPVPQTKSQVFYAYQLGPLTAAVAAHGATNKWQAIPVIPLADNDEIHFNWLTPYDFDFRHPVLIRWGLISSAASKALTLTTTYSTVDMGASFTGSGDAGDGGTALTQTIAAVTTGNNPGANKPFMSQVGTIEGKTSDYDILEIKGVASGATTADNVKVWCLEISYRPLTA